MRGILRISPVSAKLNFNEDWFKKMDPFVEMQYGEQVRRTKTAYKQGVNPHWDHEKLDFIIDGTSTSILIRLKDEDLLKDDSIGDMSISVNELCSRPNYSEWIPLHKGKHLESGQIMIVCEFFKPTEPHPANIKVNADHLTAFKAKYSAMGPGEESPTSPIRSEAKLMDEKKREASHLDILSPDFYHERAESPELHPQPRQEKGGQHFNLHPQQEE